MATFDTSYLEKILEVLSKLPRIKEVTALQRRLGSELQKISTVRPVKHKPSREEKRNSANKKRSGKLRKYHNYIRQIHDNFPEFSYAEIRRQLTRRRNGEDVPIPDAVWQNPSP